MIGTRRRSASPPPAPPPGTAAAVPVAGGALDGRLCWSGYHGQPPAWAEECRRPRLASHNAKARCQVVFEREGDRILQWDKSFNGELSIRLELAAPLPGTEALGSFENPIR
jgi:hypothetical protein